MLSGDKAYELFMSNEPFPLHTFLDEWKASNAGHPGYVIAVIGAYQDMIKVCADGRYNGVKRGH